MRNKLRIFIRLTVGILFSLFIFKTFLYFSQATSKKADIVIDTKKIVGYIPENWRGLAQGGEESDKPMLSDVIEQTAALFPKYIRIDHIYDFYQVVSRSNQNQIILNWKKLDKTVCDIYRIGAKPFFSLGYMPSALSENGSLISNPNNWNEWSFIVQKTIERYSGKNTRLCDQVYGDLLKDVYYEVWNEPDLETFGKWSIYNTKKDYKKLYFYSVKGAKLAQHTQHFYIGGPATTALYKNWIKYFLDFAIKNNLRVDFISWHHYSKKPNDFYQDLKKLNVYLSNKKYTRFRFVKKIISEWGYDSEINPVANNKIGTAHTVAAIKNLIDQQLDLAFAFEIKDGPKRGWGMLDYQGKKKPRYYALRSLNNLSKIKLEVQGEGSFVKAIASYNRSEFFLILVNYDEKNKNTELVPIKFINLRSGKYRFVQTYIDGATTETNITLNTNYLKRSILMSPNSVVSITLKRLY